MSIILKAENISKQYRLGTVGTGTLSHDLNRWWHTVRGKEDPYLKVGGINDRSAKATEDYVWALRDISFEVKQGEVIGIIGKNGAGKSTLLKILSRVTAPTTGTIKTKGRIASLLEVGTGFHPELSGRENIYLNGAILGMTKGEITAKLEEIIDFSGCEMYIDTPAKRYSSGMTVRLAFAVAAHLEPEILVVDEVLAVGDAEFQNKAIGKMQDISQGEGRTVLFVSHNMSSIRTLCSSGILLENGLIQKIGNTDEILTAYLKSSLNKKKWEGEDGDSEVQLLQTEICGEDFEDKLINTKGIKINMKIKLNKKSKDLVIGFSILSGLGNVLASVLFNDYNTLRELDAGTHELNFFIPPKFFATGNYKIEFNLSIPYVKKISSDKSSLNFEIIAINQLGNRFNVQNNKYLNSVIRPDWFHSINKLK